MSVLTAKHISTIIEFLNQEADYAVLRNFEGLPDKNESRDIDLIITRQSLNDINDRLIKMIDDSGWKIITYLNSDRLITYVCAYQAGEVIEIVQWDFFINTSVFGIVLMDAEEFLKDRKFNGFLYFVNEDAQFLDKYLYNRAVGSAYPEKYKSIRDKVEHTDTVRQKLKSLYGIDSVVECDNVSGKRLVWSAMASNIKHSPLRSLVNILRFLYTFVRNYICSNTGLSIGFTGPDGSGKTTVIELLLDSMGDVFHKAHKYYHFRPALLGNLGEVAHSAGLKKEVDREYNKPHRGGKTGKLSSFVRLLYYSVDYMIGYFIKIKTVTRITRMVIFDRYYTDIICDSRRSRIYLSPKFLYGFGRCFIPSLNYNILLTADTDVILARKRELDRVGIETINKKIDYLADKKGYYKILNNTTPQDAVAKILGIVFEEQHRKNLKRLQ